MPLLATYLGGLFASIASFFALSLTKKTAYALAAITVFGLLTGALMVVFATAINAVFVLVTLPAGVIQGISFFMPSNLPACVAAIVAADTAIALYKWNCENLKLASYIT